MGEVFGLSRRLSTFVGVLAFGTAAALDGCSTGQSSTETGATVAPASGGEVTAAESISSAPAQPQMEYAIAIHGGAGGPSRDISPEERAKYGQALASALRTGRDMLAKGGSALDVVETVVRALEDEALFNAGKGAVFTHAGTHELDASIMDGRDLSTGAVGAVRTVKNPITLARAVMEHTRHVLLVGDGAEQFAKERKVDRVNNSYFSTKHRRQQWEEKKALERQRDPSSAAALNDRRFLMGTVGAVALDKNGHLAAATSTGGLTDKRWGRIGDAPIVGAGTYADNKTCAVSGTGIGEEFIRHGVARSIAAEIEHGAGSLDSAAKKLVHQRLKPDQGGVIAVSVRGEIALEYNTDGMLRAAADSAGRFEVFLWESPEQLQD